MSYGTVDHGQAFRPVPGIPSASCQLTERVNQSRLFARGSIFFNDVVLQLCYEVKGSLMSKPSFKFSPKEFTNDQGRLQC